MSIVALERTMESRLQRLYIARLNELGWTQQRLIQEVVEIRKRRGEETSAMQIQSTIARTLREPEGRATYLNLDVIEALGGELRVIWKKEEEVKI